MHEFSAINGLLWAGILLPVGVALIFVLYQLTKSLLEDADLDHPSILHLAKIIFAISLLCSIAGTFKACGSIDWSTPCYNQKNAVKGGE